MLLIEGASLVRNFKGVIFFFLASTTPTTWAHRHKDSAIRYSMSLTSEDIDFKWASATNRPVSVCQIADFFSAFSRREIRGNSSELMC